MALSDDLVRKLQKIRLQLNVAKAIVSPSEVEPPSSLQTKNSEKLRVLKQQGAHKGLGCLISAAGSRNTQLDLQHHFQVASKKFTLTDGYCVTKACPFCICCDFSKK